MAGLLEERSYLSDPEPEAQPCTAVIICSRTDLQHVDGVVSILVIQGFKSIHHNGVKLPDQTFPSPTHSERFDMGAMFCFRPHADLAELCYTPAQHIRTGQTDEWVGQAASSHDFGAFVSLPHRVLVLETKRCKFGAIVCCSPPRYGGDYRRPSNPKDISGRA